MLLAFVQPSEQPLPSFDNRKTAGAVQIFPTADQQQATAQIRARIDDIQVDFDSLTGAPNWIWSKNGFLSGPTVEDEILYLGVAPAPPTPAVAQSDPDRRVKQFLADNPNIFGHGADALDQARKKTDFVGERNGLRTIVWEQQVNDIPVFEGIMIAHVTKNGELVNLASHFLPNPIGAASFGGIDPAAIVNAPAISARQAVSIAAAFVDVTILGEQQMAMAEVFIGTEKHIRFAGGALVGEADLRLVWMPFGRDRLTLCWDAIVKGDAHAETYRLLLDAVTGNVVIRRCLTDYYTAATYRVYTSDSPSPFSPGYSTPSTAQPPTVQRTLLAIAALSQAASPNGWINDADNQTVGNNVDAHLDVNGDDQPDLPRPQGSPFRVFDLQLDLTAAPATYGNAAVVQLFYWNNWAHDRLFDLGFTEAAGNFQAVNFTSSGVGGDAVLADAQDGVSGPGPRFTTPPCDGLAPRMEMPILPGAQPNRDPDLDAEVLIHEYCHGLSNRRVGNGVGIDSGAQQTVGMGEGWSDFYSLALLSESTDAPNGDYAAGGYSSYQIASSGFAYNYYYGIRRYPYTTDTTKNPLTFKDIDPAQADPHAGISRSPLVGPVISTDAREPHNVGEVWCVTLWEARVSLIAKYGFSTGNDLIMRLVMEGMNLSPANPNFLEARDAILQADRVNHAGANQNELWAAFAKRGLGYSAVSPPSYYTANVAEAFDLPPANGLFWTYTTGNAIYSSPAIGVDGTIYVGSTDARLHAVNPDGTAKWTFSGGNSFDSSPAIGTDGTIYVGCKDYKVYAISRDGTLKWQYNAGGEVFSSPAIAADGSIYVGVVDTTRSLTALNQDGTLKWVFATGNYVYSAPAIATDGTVYVGSMNGNLYAVNPDGTQKWVFTAGDSIASSPSIDDDGNIYIGSYDGKVYSLSPASGSKRWEFFTGDVVRSSPATFGLRIYVGSSNYKCYCLNSLNGTEIWERATGFYVWSSPAVGLDGTVFMASYDGKIYTLDPVDGSVKSSTYLAGGIYSSPVISPYGPHNRLYLGTPAGKLCSYLADVPQGRGAWPMYRQNFRHMSDRTFIELDSGFSNASANVFLFNVNYSKSLFAQLQLRVEYSDDLANWSTLTTFNQSGANATTIQDSTLTGSYHRFYRVKQPTSGFPRSHNAYGFMTLTIPTGQSMIANQLNASNQTVRVLFRDIPNGTTVYKYNENTGLYDAASKANNIWSGPNFSVSAGEGVFINNTSGASFNITFVGEVMHGILLNKFPTGDSIRSSIVPQLGALDSALAFPASDGDTIFRFNNVMNSYDTYSYYVQPPPVWFPSVPIPNVGESFWIRNSTGAARSWTRNFSVW